MDDWITFAKGPLFAVTFLVMVLGLARQVALQTYFLAVRKGRRLRDAPWSRIARETLSWAVPIRHVEPGAGTFTAASFLMHVGIILVPLFLVDHVALWNGLLGTDLPALPPGVADWLTLLTVGCGLLLLSLRLVRARHRVVSRRSDCLLLLLVLAPFVTGYMASHPRVNPFPWDAVMLTHLLSAELLFVVTPFTKLSHVVLFFFDRISAVHWHLRPGAGDRVAEALRARDIRIS
jgi:nitrate reductase gamma subunit